MPDDRIRISALPPATTPSDADVLAGVQSGTTKKFSLATIKSWLQTIFVPVTRTVNNKALSADITLDASDVGARADNWLPSAADVGAVDVNDVGVAGGVAELDVSGKVPSTQLPQIASAAEDVTYDNTGSGLAANDVQEAIDELAAGAGGGGVDPETIAPVETSTTATVAHPLGTIFYLNDVLYRALSDIAVGGTINTAAGGNAVQTTIAQNFTRIVKITKNTYNALTPAEKAADIVYIITNDPVDYAEQSQLATVEDYATAQHNYAIGERFCWNKIFYKVISPIATGEPITPGTNCEATTVAAEMGIPVEYTIPTTSKFSDLTGAVYRVGNVVVLAFRGTASEAMASNTELLRFPNASTSVNGQIVTITRASTLYTGRVNGGTLSSVPTGRLLSNTAISASDNISIFGMYFT